MHDTSSLGRTVDASSVPTPALIKNIGKDLKNLADLEIKLAQAEAKADFAAELHSAKLAAIALVCALLGLNLLAVSLALLFTPEYAWLVACIESLVFFAVAAYCGWLGWNQMHKKPLVETRATLKEVVEWIRGQIR